MTATGETPPVAVGSHEASRRRLLERIAWILLAIAVSALFGLPSFRLIANGISPIVTANESIAYRYFSSMRILDRERGFVFLLQGHTPGIFYHGTNLFLSYLCRIPENDLRRRMDTFAFIVMSANVLAMAAILFIGLLRKTMARTDKFLLAMVSLASAYSSRESIVYSTKPDYYAFEMTLNALAFLLYVIHIQRENQRPIRRAIVLGCVAGLMAATKITLLGIGAVILWPVIFPHPFSLRALLTRLGAATVGVLGGFWGAIWVFYFFSFRALIRFWDRWIDLIAKSGGLDPNFRQSFWAGKTVYSYIWLLLVSWLMVIVISGILGGRRGAMNWYRLGLIAIILIAGAAHLSGFLLHPAGTTVFDFGLYLAASSAICVARTQEKRLLCLILPLLVIVPLGALSASTLFRGLPFNPHLPRLKQESREVWAMHDWLLAQNRPVLVLMSDNRYEAFIVPTALLKGLSNSPEWVISNGREMLSRIAPGFSFYQRPIVVPSDCVILWVEVPELDSMVDRTPSLRRALELPDTECKDWYISQRRIRACVVKSMPELRLTLHQGPHEKGNSVEFVGRREHGWVGELDSVAGNGVPNVSFRVLLSSPNDSLTIVRVEIFSSDNSGNPDGGGIWDTDSPGVRAIGLVRGGELLNRGSKRLPNVRLGSRAPLEIFIDDGKMTTFWEYFTIQIHLHDGSYYEAVLRLGDLTK